MLSSPYILIAILALVCGFMALVLYFALERIERLERIVGIRSAKPRRRGHLPEERHIRSVPVRVERRVG